MRLQNVALFLWASYHDIHIQHVKLVSRVADLKLRQSIFSHREAEKLQNKDERTMALQLDGC